MFHRKGPSLLDMFHLGNDPVPNNMFSVSVGAIPFGLFTKVSGIGYTVEPQEIVEFGRNNSAHYKPFAKPGKWEEVELEWGAVRKQLMEAWMQHIAPGYPFRRNVFITQVMRSGWIPRTYVLMGAWPKQWKVGELNSTGNDISTESLTLVCENVITVSL